MTHIEQVTAAMSDLIGRPFEPSRGQITRLRDGETTEAVIASLPGQIADRRGDVAKQLSEQIGRDISIDMIEPWMVAHLLRLDMPINGFSDRSAWRELRPDALIEVGARAVKNDVANMHWIAKLYIEIVDRVPDKEGFAAWIEALEKGHTQEEVRSWIVSGLELEAKNTSVVS